MKNLFILKSKLPAEAREKISAFPGAASFNLDDNDGWVIEEGQLKEVLLFLGATQAIQSVQPDKSRAAYQGLDLVEFSFDFDETDGKKSSAKIIKLGNINVLSWNGRESCADWLKEAITEMLLPLLKGRGVDIFVPHQNARGYDRDSKNFQIFIWSSPGTDSMVYPPAEVWGIEVSCRDKAFKALGTGEVFVDEATGYTVAELFDNNFLYIYHDLVDKGSDSERLLINELFKRVAEEFSLSKKEKAERVLRRIEEAKRRARLQYIAECNKRRTKIIAVTEKNVKEGNEAILEIQQELIKKIRETQGQEQKLQQLKLSNILEEKFGEEYDKLLSLPQIIRVAVDDNVLKVYTETLYCVDPRTNKNHEIGEFEIKIPMDGRGGVRWNNLTRRVDGYSSNQMAPHIWKDGDACLGNTKEIFPELIANYEFSIVALMAIQFVESVNVDDAAGKHIHLWPEAKKIIKEPKKIVKPDEEIMSVVEEDDERDDLPF